MAEMTWKLLRKVGRTGLKGAIRWNELVRDTWTVKEKDAGAVGDPLGLSQLNPNRHRNGSMASLDGLFKADPRHRSTARDQFESYMFKALGIADPQDRTFIDKINDIFKEHNVDGGELSSALVEVTGPDGQEDLFLRSIKGQIGKISLERSGVYFFRFGLTKSNGRRLEQQGRHCELVLGRF